MKVGLIQLDGKRPNLALLKLATWHKNKGDDITILDLSGYKFDVTYASKIFAGGSGYNIKAKLPDGIEEVVPDYNAFNLDYSIVHTTRGCFRSCDFCIVKEKEGELTEIDNWKEKITKSKVILLDNNFLASKYAREKLQYFIDNKIKVCFDQGLDIRLVNEEYAQLLSKVKYYDSKFNYRVLYFAFDDVNIEPIIRKKIPILINGGIKSHHLMFYMLIGFNSSINDDLKRVNILWDEFGCLPFVMIYNNKKGKLLHLFSKWVNKRVHKKYTWDEWLDYTNYKEERHYEYLQ